jgi:hypothetical protein
LSKFFISCTFIKLFEQSLHAQNVVGLRVLRPSFEFLCVINRDLVGGGNRETDENQIMSQKLHLIGWCWAAASAIGPHHSQEIL